MDLRVGIQVFIWQFFQIFGRCKNFQNNVWWKINTRLKIVFNHRICVCMWTSCSQIPSCLAVLFFIFIYLSGCSRSYLWHPGSSIFFAACEIFSCGMWTLSCGMWDQVPWPKLNLGPLHWKCGILATAPPENSFIIVFCLFVFLMWQNTLYIIFNHF